MKRIVLMIFFLLLPFLAFAAFPVAKVRATKVYKSQHYGETGQMTVKEFHHPVSHDSVKVLELHGENHYAINEELEGMEWLNRHTRGDIFDGGAPVYHQQTGEYLDLFRLHPGFYHLDLPYLDEAKKMPGYKALKAVMGNRVELVAPEGPGHLVGIRIYGPQDKRK